MGNKLKPVVGKPEPVAGKPEPVVGKRLTLAEARLLTVTTISIWALSISRVVSR